MKTAAIIAEYNPFHSGHAYHITRTRKKYGASHIVAVMSGNFVQRGDCACISKWERTKMALLGGADLVVELPLPWAMAGAERFATGGVALAQALGCVDMLSFGSECGNIDAIRTTTDAAEREDVIERMKAYLDSGETFAAARDRAVSELVPGAEGILRSPNDTLAVEYCRAITRLGADIEPVCILREGAGHNSLDRHPSHVSSTYIRSLLAKGDISMNIPPEIQGIISDAISHSSAPASLERLDRAMLYRLRGMSTEDIASLPDISEGLENRIFSCLREAEDIPSLCDAIKTKRYTHARIRRIVLSALLGLDDADGEGIPPYIRVLGMNERGRELLHEAQPTLPVITRFSDLAKADERAKEIFAKEMLAGDIFALSTPKVLPCGLDASHGIVVM